MCQGLRLNNKDTMNKRKTEKCIEKDQQYFEENKGFKKWLREDYLKKKKIRKRIRKKKVLEYV